MRWTTAIALPRARRALELSVGVAARRISGLRRTANGVKFGAMSERPLAASPPARDIVPIPVDPVVVIETFECPAHERPVHATIEGIAEQLSAPLDHIGSGVPVFDQFAWNLVAAGIPVLRVTLHVGTLHPQFLGTTTTWWRDTGQTVQVMIKHEVADAIPYEKNPVRRVCQGRETLRRRLDQPDELLDFSVLKELRERGSTDYLALPIPGMRQLAYMVICNRPVRRVH
jgi:hypothetical protein